MPKVKKTVSRSRGFCFTLNNYEADAYEKLQRIEAKYICYQKEVAPSTGTPHIQGYLYLPSGSTITAIQKKFKKENLKVAVLIANGTADQNKEYCSKEGGTDFVERGTKPKQGNRSDLDEVAAAIVTGTMTVTSLRQTNPGLIIKYHKGLQFLQSGCVLPRDATITPTVHWWFGSTGTGKSRQAFEMFPKAYWKMSCNHWWDGYAGEKEVIIDDYRTSMCTFDYLLRILDRYPMRVEMKGSTIALSATTFIITAPYRPEEMWNYKTEEAIAQLLRRISSIMFFRPDGSKQCLKSDEIVYIPIEKDIGAISKIFNLHTNKK